MNLKPKEVYSLFTMETNFQKLDSATYELWLHTLAEEIAFFNNLISNF